MQETAGHAARGAHAGGLHQGANSKTSGSTSPRAARECNEGYRGRTGIFEVMPITDAIARIILEEGNAIRIQEQARAEGIFDLRQSALK